MSESRSTRDKLSTALALLMQEFPESKLTEATLTFSMGERHDHGPSETWSRVEWNLQSGNERAHGESFDGALERLRQSIHVNLQIPQHAERIAAVLREIPDVDFVRERAVMAAREILNKERQRGR